MMAHPLDGVVIGNPRFMAKLKPLTDEERQSGFIAHIHANGVCVYISTSEDGLGLDYVAHDDEGNHYQGEYRVKATDTRGDMITGVVKDLLNKQVNVAFLQRLKQEQAGYCVRH